MIIIIESDYKTLLLSMLSDYINCCCKNGGTCSCTTAANGQCCTDGQCCCKDKTECCCINGVTTENGATTTIKLCDCCCKHTNGQCTGKCDCTQVTDNKCYCCCLCDNTCDKCECQDASAPTASTTTLERCCCKSCGTGTEGGCCTSCTNCNCQCNKDIKLCKCCQCISNDKLISCCPKKDEKKEKKEGTDACTETSTDAQTSCGTSQATCPTTQSVENTSCTPPTPTATPTPQSTVQSTESTNCKLEQLKTSLNSAACEVLKNLAGKITTSNGTNTCPCASNENKTKIENFVEESMENCIKEAKELIDKVNAQVIDTKPYEEMEPFIKEFSLRILCLLLYKRMVEELILLHNFLECIIENLSTCDAIKSCTCGSAGQSTNNNCSKDSKCLCSIFYKLFKATVSLHDRYCKIIGYMRGECDEDLYKVIPSLSLTRSMYLLTKYFNDYIKSGYMVEESSCGCGYNVYVEPSLFRSIASIAVETVLWLFSTVTESKYTGLSRCPCHKYSSKLDDVVTLLLEAMEDTDDCDGILSDVISMISPLVKVDDCRSVAIKTELTEADKKNETEIEEQLKKVNQQKKNGLKSVPGLNGESSCDGNIASGGGGTVSPSNGCEVCNGTPSAETTTTDCNGDIDSACGQYISGNADTTGCAAPTTCECECEACTGGKAGECCCFCKDTHNSTHDEKSKTCMNNSIKKLTERLHCNGNDCRRDMLEERKFHHATLTLLKI